jgi:hypothetical protein
MIPIRCKTGDLVEVRAPHEILATLDDNGCLDNLPFMPEMLQFCGKRFRVFGSAHKSCDSTYYKLGRYMQDAVFLEDLRCDGAGHDGCEAKCSLFFKLAWLKPVSPARDWGLAKGSVNEARRDEEWLRTTVFRERGEAPKYRCQATEHLNATVSFTPLSPAMFAADIRSRNASLFELCRGLVLLLTWHARNRAGIGWRVLNAAYVGMHRSFFGTGSPYYRPTIPRGQPTPDVRIDLTAGEWARVKPLGEIEKTLNGASKNRGLSFNPEMSVFCGGTYRVERRVTRILDEKTGAMLKMKGPCIMLDGVRCTARYHPEALLCRRRIPQYFREAWLERAPQGAPGKPQAPE